MKKIKSVDGVLRESGLVEALIESVSRTMNIDRNIASKIVQMRMDSVLNKLGKSMQDGQYQIKKGDIPSKLSEMSTDDILNNENIIKDK